MGSLPPPPFADPRLQAQNETVDPREYQDSSAPDIHGLGLPPPPISSTSGLSSTNESKTSLLKRILPYLPTLASGVMGVIGGPNSALGEFGRGGAESGSKILLDQAARKQALDHEADQNRIKNVGARMDKLRRLSSDPRYAAVVQAYDQALVDGKFTAKEAANIQSMADALPDPEGIFQEQEMQRAITQASRIKEAEDKLKRQNEVDTPFGRMDPVKLAEYKMREASLKAADERMAAIQDRIDKRSGNYLPEYDEFGNLLGYTNPKTGETKAPAFAGARKPRTDQANTRIGMAKTMLEDLDTLETLANKNTGSIGRIEGPVAAGARWVGLSSEEQNDMFRLSQNMQDMLLRARSGAQINEAEYKRLSRLVPDPNTAEGQFFSNLKNFKSELQRTFQYSTGLPPPGRTPTRGTIPQTPGLPPPSTGRFEIISVE